MKQNAGGGVGVRYIYILSKGANSRVVVVVGKSGIFFIGKQYFLCVLAGKWDSDTFLSSERDKKRESRKKRLSNYSR